MADIKMINNYNIKDETARNEIEAVRAQIPDVSNLATKAEIPTNVSELNNDMGYIYQGLFDATIGDINAILDNINGEEI